MSPLRISLVGFGIIFCSVYGLFQIDLFGGWAWSPGQPEYQLMIVGIYLVMGLMMIFQASKDPLKHILFIRFVVEWSPNRSQYWTGWFSSIPVWGVFR